MLKYNCSKFSGFVGVHGWKLPYGAGGIDEFDEPSGGWELTTTSIAGGLGIVIHAQHAHTVDGCPLPPEGEETVPYDAYQVSVFAEFTVRNCRDYRISAHGEGCTWFSYPLLEVRSGYGGGYILHMFAWDPDYGDICQAPSRPLDIGPYAVDMTNPAYWSPGQCEDKQIIVSMEFYTRYCNAVQDITLTIEPV